MAAEYRETGQKMDLNSLMKLASNPQVRQLLTSLLGQIGGKGGGTAAGGANMAGLLDNLSGGGLGDQVKSWVGTGDNAQVSPQQITQAIGPDQLHQAATAAGMTDQQAADSLAKVLPQVVDQATPTGQPPAPADFQQLFARLMGDSPK